jgi:hypothetical protein
MADALVTSDDETAPDSDEPISERSFFQAIAAITEPFVRYQAQATIETARIQADVEKASLAAQSVELESGRHERLTVFRWLATIATGIIVAGLALSAALMFTVDLAAGLSVFTHFGVAVMGLVGGQGLPGLLRSLSRPPRDG